MVEEVNGKENGPAAGSPAPIWGDLPPDVEWLDELEAILSAAAEIKPRLGLLVRMAASLLAGGDVGTTVTVHHADPAAKAVEAGTAPPDLRLTGWAFEAGYILPTIRTLAQVGRKLDPALAGPLEQVTRMLQDLHRWGVSYRHGQVESALKETGRWAEDLARSLGSPISVHLRPAKFTVSEGVLRETCRLVKEVFSAALPLRARDRQQVVPVHVGARKTESFIQVLISGLPSFRRQSTLERLEMLDKHLRKIGARLRRNQPATELIVEFPRSARNLEVVVARVGTSFIAFPSHHVLEVREQVVLEDRVPVWEGEELQVEDRRSLPGPTTLVLVNDGEGARGVTVDRVVSRQEILVEEPHGDAKLHCLLVEDGRRVPLVGLPPAPREKPKKARGKKPKKKKG